MPSPGTHLPNVHTAYIRDARPMKTKGGAYVWDGGRLVTLYPTKDKNHGIIAPTHMVLELHFGNQTP